jgi:hypothetical protein
MLVRLYELLMTVNRKLKSWVKEILRLSGKILRIFVIVVDLICVVTLKGLKRS